MAHGGVNSVRTRTDHGKRAHGTDKSVTKRRNRDQDARIVAAREEVAAERERVEQMIASGSTTPAIRASCSRCSERPPVGTSSMCLECQTTVEALAAMPTTKEQVGTTFAEKNPAQFGRGTCPQCGRKDVPHNKVGGFKSHFVPDTKDRCHGQPRPQLVKSDKPKRTIKRKHWTERLPQQGNEKWQYGYTTARQMLKSGYNVRYVIKFTGVGFEDLKDIEIDENGYGIIESEDEAE